MKFEDYKEYLSPALAKSTDLVAASAKGCYMTDVNGKEYLDFVQGIAVNALGHCHPKVVEAICEQTKKLITGSFNLVNYPATLELAKELAKVTPGNLDVTFFSNGGAEATDAALKLAKKLYAPARNHRIQRLIPRQDPRGDQRHRFQFQVQKEL